MASRLQPSAALSAGAAFGLGPGLAKAEVEANAMGPRLLRDGRLARPGDVYRKVFAVFTGQRVTPRPLSRIYRLASR